MVLPVFEIYLAVSLIVHAFLAAKTVYTKGTSSIGWLATTGAVMLFFLITHLLDFRFAGENVLQDLGHFMPCKERKCVQQMCHVMSCLWFVHVFTTCLCHVMPAYDTHSIPYLPPPSPPSPPPTAAIVSDKKLWYTVGIVATTIHCVKAIRIAWFLSLGFKMKEIPYLMFIGRVMTFVSAVAYLVPVVKL